MAYTTAKHSCSITDQGVVRCSHFEDFIEDYCTPQSIDVDTDERMNGFISTFSSPLGLKGIKALGVRAQNALRTITVNESFDIGPCDPHWRPTHGVWCTIGAEDGGYNFVKIISLQKVPNSEADRVKRQMITLKSRHPGVSFYFIRYYKSDGIDEISRDCLLSPWEDQEGDSYDVEAQGSMLREVRVYDNRLIRFHPMNQFYFE
ncbi:hypothetical protein ADUPG1_006421 [Aduncisulcus paluster]|uniref:Uncharacterized protein n=1 Tax=Aduncisulcus paluster TaxID=2918883 RepID=A0ABQ5KI69_9EUKA|nr:hypothetical protein ADUPG1_006421 [Aduncisulcus paluster]